MLAQFHDAFTIKHTLTGLEIHGTEGSLLARDVMTQQPKGEIVLRRGSDEEQIDLGQHEDLYTRSVRNFTAAMLGEGAPSATALHQLRSGIQVGEFRALPAQARWVAPPDWLWPRVPPVRFRKSVPDTWVEITIGEGRNRQVRRMTAHIGFPTLRLVRWRIGSWTLDGIPHGKFVVAQV